MDDPNKRNNRNHLSLFLNNSSFSRKRNLKKVEYEKKKKKKRTSTSLSVDHLPVLDRTPFIRFPPHNEPI